MSTETRQGQPRYWCHICNAEVNIYMAPDPTCQQCNEQFIEELQADDDPREFLAGTDNNHHANNLEGGNIPEGGAAHIFSYSPSTGRFNNLHGNNNGEMGDDIFQYFTPHSATANNTTDDHERTSPEAGANNASPLGNMVQNLLTNILGQNIDLSGQMSNTTTEGGATGTDSTRPMMFYGSVVDGNMRFQPMPGMPGSMPGGTPTDGDNEATNNNERGTTEEGTAGTGATGVRGNNIAGILQFLSAMTGAPLDAGLVGNPNDYVFSQTALDNIITQLMEQTGGASAPPPAPEQVIESLKKRNLTDKEKTTETDCAVCKDQFESHEIVIELPCEHIFHDECIKPWLKLNSTCPVCRHSVLPEQESANDQNNNNNNNDNNNTQNTQQTRETTDVNNPTGTTASYTWVSGNGGNSDNGGSGGGNSGTSHQGMPTSFPVNLASAFPWISNLTGNASRSNNTPTASNTNTNTTNTTNTNTSNNITSNTNTHLDDNLDLD